MANQGWIRDMGLLMVVTFLLTYLFFNLWYLSLLGSLSCLLWIKKMKRNNERRTKTKIEEEFKSFIFSLSSTMSVGKSFESAWVEALEELKKEKSKLLIQRDIEEISKGFSLNMNLHQSFKRFAMKYNVEIINHFSTIIEISIVQGSSIQAVIEKTIQMIDEKHNVEKELEVIITQKKFELYILLSFVPFIIVYMRMTSNAFEDTMYHSIEGRGIMLLALLLYAFSYFIGRKVVAIEI